MHRAAPASRAFGRYAVGLPADPGHRRLTRRAQTTADNGQTTINTTTQPGLDRPRSFRNDNKEGSIWYTAAEIKTNTDGALLSAAIAEDAGCLGTDIRADLKGLA
jgi:hypothetical protein